MAIQVTLSDDKYLAWVCCGFSRGLDASFQLPPGPCVYFDDTMSFRIVCCVPNNPLLLSLRVLYGDGVQVNEGFFGSPLSSRTFISTDPITLLNAFSLVHAGSIQTTQSVADYIYQSIIGFREKLFGLMSRWQMTSAMTPCRSCKAHGYNRKSV